VTEEGLYILFERTATLVGWARFRRDQESVFLLEEGGYRLSSCHVDNAPTGKRSMIRGYTSG